MSTPNPIAHPSFSASDVVAPFLCNKDSITEVLSSLHTAGTLICVQIEGAERRYHSAFLSIDSKSNSIEIDELIPSKANDGLQIGTSITISAKLQGMSVCFQSRITRIDKYNYTQRYTAKMPEAVAYDERRDEARYPTDADTTVHLRGKHPVTGENLFGSLIDISSSGCAFKLSGNQHDLALGITLRPVTLIFPDDTSIQTHLQIHNQTTTRQTRSTRYGGEFQFQSEAQENLLAKLVQTLQHHLEDL